MEDVHQASLGFGQCEIAETKMGLAGDSTNMIALTAHLNHLVKV